MTYISKTVAFLLAVLIASAARGQTVDAKQQQVDSAVSKDKIPFDGYDLTWINGQNRQTDFPLTVKDKAGETIFTAVGFIDCYYNYDFNNPLDNTHTISSSIGRSNEFTVNMASIGIESYYKNAIGRLWLQYGQMASIVQDLDGSVYHGRNTNISSLKYIREAVAGYHIDKWYGLNIEMGIFTSYIGLESYVQNENWCYQRSMPCEFTPFYFSGARIQAYLNKKIKQEIWLLNGWQSYNGWNKTMGLGSSTYYRPNTNLQFVGNFYFAGHDTRNNPDILRFHHDHSAVVRYYNKPAKKGISQCAVSINNHYGFQTGGGVRAKNQYMLATSLTNRIWLFHNKFALTLRGDYVTNPGAYLAFSPSPVATNDYTDAISAGKTLTLLQGTATFDIMPTQYTTFRIEYGYRSSSIPYFAGGGGTTAPDGWVNTPTTAWRPDLQKTEGRLTVAVTFRM